LNESKTRTATSLNSSVITNRLNTTTPTKDTTPKYNMTHHNPHRTAFTSAAQMKTSMTTVSTMIRTDVDLQSLFTTISSLSEVGLQSLFTTISSLTTINHNYRYHNSNDNNDNMNKKQQQRQQQQ
jgi:hypothetical protein